MNILTGKTVGVVYNTLTADLSCLASIPIVYWAAPTATFVDVTAGGSHAAIDVLINAALTDGTLDYAIMITSITDTYTTTGTPDYDNVATLWAKLKTANKGTEILTGTSPGGGVSSTSKLVLVSYPAAADDAYNGLMLEITAGTNDTYIGKILDSDKSDANVEIGGAVAGAAFDNTSVYSIYDAQDYLFVVQDAAYAQTGATYFYSAKNALTRGCYKLWESIHTNGVAVNTVPWIIFYIGNYLFDLYHGTSTAAAETTTLTDAGATWTVDAYAGKYVYTYSGTGENQWAQIVSNTATALTCRYFNGDYGKLGSNATVGGNAAWTTAVTTCTYRIVDQYTDILRAEYMQMYIRNVLNQGVSGAQLLLDAQKLIDNNGKIDTYTYGAPDQDLDFLMECLEYGKAAYESSIVTAITTLV